MSWTVACFCGTVFHAPLDRCPTCGTPLPDVSRNEPVDAAAPSAEQRTLTDKNVERHDIARAQRLIDDTVVLMRRTAAALGARWWEHQRRPGARKSLP
jgi:hypothetical protein